MSGDAVKVVARFRPQNSVEHSENGQICVQLSEDQVQVTTEDASSHKFNFDRVFGMDSTQQQVFEYCALPVVRDVLDGYNGTLFAYGQTGSGKTHTMEGPSVDDVDQCGLIPRLIFAVFGGIASSDPIIEYQVMVQYVEIYMERVRDLLDPTKQNLSIREDKTRGIYIQDCSNPYVTCADDMFNLMKLGGSNRAVGATRMNAGSSRSHSIFLVSVLQKNTETQSTKQGRLFLVDLAGSEMIKKTQAEGHRLEEAKTINKSLSALGNVINSLTDSNRDHVPYRDSKLTRILQQSLGGNSRTTLIICMSSSSYNAGETLSTLRFGTRAKSVKNKATKNEEKSAAELTAMLNLAQGKINKLETKIKQLMGGEDVQLSDDDQPAAVGGPVDEGLKEALEELTADLEEKKMEIDALTEMLVEKESAIDEWESNSLVTSRASEAASNQLCTAANDCWQFGSTFRTKLCAADPATEAEFPAAVEGDGFELRVGHWAKTISSTVSGLQLLVIQAAYEREQLQMDAEAKVTENEQLRSELDKQRGAAAAAAATETSVTSPQPSGSAQGSQEAAAAQVALEASSQAIQQRILALNASLQASGVVTEIEPTSGSAAEQGAENDEVVEEDEEQQEVDLSGLDGDAVRQTAEQLQGEVRKLRFDLSKGTSKLENKTRHFEQQKSEWRAQHESLEAKRSLLESELQAVTEAVQKQQADAEKLTATLKKDLNDQVDRYLQLRMEVEEARSTPVKSSDQPSSASPDKSTVAKDAKKMQTLQKKLDSVTADHQWLLTQYVTVNGQNAELRKKDTLAHEHIKDLERELQRRVSKYEDETAQLMAEKSQAHARELQALEARDMATKEIASLRQQLQFGEMRTREPTEDSANALRQHIQGALHNSSGGHSPTHTSKGSPLVGGNFAPPPLRGGGGAGITNLIDGASPEEAPKKNFFKRLFS